MFKKYKIPTQRCKVALIGNPNCGKSTLFNCLTGAQQQIGNWPGVTVEQKNGKYFDSRVNFEIQVVDLPGCYSLIETHDMALDERISCDYILTAQDTLYVNVVDAAHLGRDLYLTLQLLELGLPVVIALNCIDIAKQSGLKIDPQILSQTLGCPVVPIVAKSGKNIAALKQQISLAATKPLVQQSAYIPDYPQHLTATINAWAKHLTVGQALHTLEGDEKLAEKLATAHIDVTGIRQQLTKQIAMPLDLYVAQHRRKIMQNIINAAVIKVRVKTKYTEHIDAVVLHKYLGPVIFVSVMYLMFTFAINLGGFLQQGFDQTSETIFITSFAGWLSSVGAAPWLIDILANGIGKGLNISITFIPVLAAMFLSLGILESSGYMTRAAFLVDRVMRVFGLPGKAFVPMIVGFGCNVPAVMGARTLASKRERILTIMMTPFMSCSARLAIYAIFVTAFFPTGGQNVIFSLYLIGILVAVLTGFALRSAVLPHERAISLMEMSDYRWPALGTLLRQVWRRLKSFLLKASGLIIVLCVLINGIGYENLEKIGKKITPAFAPIGISAENWPATVGLVTGLIAKEAVIGTLNSVYSTAAGAEQVVVSENSLSRTAETEMVLRFGGATAAYAYLLFTLLYFPCVSVVAVIAKELNKGWALFSVLWSTGLAYIIAALYYQIATWTGWQSSATIWIFGLSLALATAFMLARMLVRHYSRLELRYKPVPTPIHVN